LSSSAIVTTPFFAVRQALGTLSLPRGVVPDLDLELEVDPVLRRHALGDEVDQAEDVVGQRVSAEHGIDLELEIEIWDDAPRRAQGAQGLPNGEERSGDYGRA